MITDKADDKADNGQLDTTDMSDLKTEESAEEKKKSKRTRIKTLTPQQMLSRLPKAGSNSQKLKNEIRQLSYLLYRSKKLSKKIYKHLRNAI